MVAPHGMQIDGQVYSVRRFLQLHFRFEHKLLGLCVAVLLAYSLFFRLAAALALKKVRGGALLDVCIDMRQSPARGKAAPRAGAWSW